jgi:GT2 family glycosyltransferase
LIDNASTDDSLSRIKASDELRKLPLVIIENHHNRGFGGACNQALLRATADFILLLNPDARCEKDTLDRMIVFMNKTDSTDIGILGVKLKSLSGIAQRGCCRFPTFWQIFNEGTGLSTIRPRTFPSHFMSEWDHQSNSFVDHVIGAFALIRMSALKRVGLFDERFFVYWEDIDWSLRAAQSGWKTYYLADVAAVHKGGGVSDQIKGRRLFYSLRSRQLFMYKHMHRYAADILFFVTLVIEPLARTASLVLNSNFRSFKELAEGYLLLYREVPNILKLRSATDSIFFNGTKRASNSGSELNSP